MTRRKLIMYIVVVLVLIGAVIFVLRDRLQGLQSDAAQLPQGQLQSQPFMPGQGRGLR